MLSEDLLCLAVAARPEANLRSWFRLQVFLSIHLKFLVFTFLNSHLLGRLSVGIYLILQSLDLVFVVSGLHFFFELWVERAYLILCIHKFGQELAIENVLVLLESLGNYRRHVFQNLVNLLLYFYCLLFAFVDVRLAWILFFNWLDLSLRWVEKVAVVIQKRSTHSRRHQKS